MAERSEGSTEIEATPAEVLEVITDFEAYPEWAGVQESEVVETDAKGRATQVRMRVSQMGFEANYTLAYTYKPKGAGLEWTTVEASGVLKDLAGEYVLEPAGDGRTTVTYRLEMELGISLPGFLRRQGEKQVINTALGGLKKRVESR
jgi:ribosome-associated toxin RatA of RatAB toxin-antitoxin module